VLEEIERDIYFNPTIRDDSNNAILIMCSDQGTCRQIREYLQTMHLKQENADADLDDDDDDKEPGAEVSAMFMMRRNLRNYLNWKREFARVSSSLFSENQKALEGFTDQRGAGGYRGKAPPNKRRRVRGGAATAGGGRPVSGSLQMMKDTAPQVEGLMAELRPQETDPLEKESAAEETFDNVEDYFELYEMDDLVLVHPYDGDMDEHVLEEVRPRYVIMYEPDAAFIRRVEVYRSSHTDRTIRVYFLYYGGSVEEQRYLSAVRKEKDAFTSLIKEKSVQAPVSFLAFQRHPTGLPTLTPSAVHGRNPDPRPNNGPIRNLPPHRKHPHRRRRPPHGNGDPAAHRRRRA
jgi:DNA excision repair protein ERCC-4